LLKTLVTNSRCDNRSEEIFVQATEQPALRQQELYTGFCTELGKLPLRCADVPPD